MRYRSAPVLVALGVLLSGCAAPGGSKTASEPIASPPHIINPNPSTAPKAGPITLAFGGDVHGEPPIAGQLAAGKNPLSDVSPIFFKADISAVNLETAISNRGTAADKKYRFRSSPLLITALKEAGVNFVNVGNNHAMDYGPLAFEDTLKEITSQGLIPIGGGMNEVEAWQPTIVKVRGTRIAYLGIAKVNGGKWTVANGDRPGTTSGWNEDQIESAITWAKKRANIVVILVHWGIELDQCPAQKDIDQAENWFSAGASIIIGSHPHVQQGAVLHDGKFIDYSLGNLVFYSDSGPATHTGVETVTVYPDGEVTGWRFHPAQINPMTGSPEILHGDAADAALAAKIALIPGKTACPISGSISLTPTGA